MQKKDLHADSDNVLGRASFFYTGKFQADYPRVFWMTKKSNGYYTIKGT